MSLEQAIYKQRRNFWDSIQAKAVPDTGINLRRSASPVKGGFKAERTKIVVDGKLLLKSEVFAYRRAEIQNRLDAINAQAKAAADKLRADDEAMRGLFEASDVKAYLIEEIKEAVCAHFGITMGELVCQRRTKEVVFKRHIAMYLCKELSHRSYPEIGRRFSGRDHTTAMSGVRKIQRWLDEGNAEVCQHVEAIKERLAGAPQSAEVE